METSSAPTAIPAIASAAKRSGGSGANANGASTRDTSSAVTPTTGRLPNFETSQPASGMETSDPIASPSNPSLKANFY